MDIKTKYHYTYFLDPFVVDEKKYEKFLFKFIKDEKWNMRMFDKVNDMEIFTHFLSQTKEMMFPSFYWSDKYKEKLKGYSNLALAKELTKVSCVEFIYNLNDFNQIQGKIEQENQIFFEITEIKLICFNTGICFLSFKTNITDESDYTSFRELLNFNHKFKDLSSSYAKYKGNDNIYIQTNQMESVEHIQKFIDSITSGYVKWENDDIYSDRMFVYSYACIDETDWNNDNTFEEIKDNFYKYVFQFSGDYDSEFELNNKELDDVSYSKWRYSKYGFTKLGGVVFTSATDHFNFTKLPVHYEKVSYYIMLLAFYQRISLLILNNELSSNEMSSSNLSDRINKELIKCRVSQISNSEHGMGQWKNWVKAFEIEELYNQLDKQYSRWLKYTNTKKSNLIYAVITFILVLIYFGTLDIGGIIGNLSK